MYENIHFFLCDLQIKFFPKRKFSNINQIYIEILIKEMNFELCFIGMLMLNTSSSFSLSSCINNIYLFYWLWNHISNTYFYAL